ncbi:MAG TPA: GNAT family N-acetyltransferase [Planctomycetota bacterium]|nr:GNAT family N-acetyltransferase [Planctomycetota bacterium]
MATEDDAIAIVPFLDAYAPAFERLSREWLEALVRVEEKDLVYLRDPRATIVAPGGEVFFAIRAGAVVGACAAIRRESGDIELAKLGVAPEARRRGVGRKLSEAVIAFARRARAAKVVLTSNSRLVPALRLYESLGFRRAPPPRDLGYETADVYLELTL